MYALLSETYDAAESVPTQLERGTEHAQRRDWQVVATFKDDGYSAFKEITRDGFGELIAAIEGGQGDVVNPLPPGAPSSPGGMLKDPAVRREREMMILRRRVEFDWRVLAIVP